MMFYYLLIILFEMEKQDEKDFKEADLSQRSSLNVDQKATVNQSQEKRKVGQIYGAGEDSNASLNDISNDHGLLANLARINSSDKRVSDPTQNGIQGGAIDGLEILKDQKPLSPGQDPSHPQTKTYQERKKAHLTQQRAKKHAVFVVNGKTSYFDLKSLYLFSATNSLRRCLAKVVLNRHFDKFILVCIITNSVILASNEYRNYYDAAYKSRWNTIVLRADQVFTIIYLIECIMKVIVMGFVRHKRAYLRSKWNRLDFFIVLIGLLNLVPSLFSNESLKSLRTLRALRPLRSIGAMSTIKLLVKNMFRSIPGLFNVCVFLSFMFGIFGIFGTLTFMGKQYNFCRATEELIDDGVNKPYWPINHDAEYLCYSDEMCSGWPNYLGADVVAKCGNLFEEYKLDPRVYDKTDELEIINYDVTNFNDVISAFLAVFQVVTLEGWSQILYIYRNSAGYFTANIYFLLVVFFGSFVSINLVLAQIMHSFLQTEHLNKVKKAQKQKLEARGLQENENLSESEDEQAHGQSLVRSVYHFEQQSKQLLKNKKAQKSDEYRNIEGQSEVQQAIEEKKGAQTEPPSPKDVHSEGATEKLSSPFVQSQRSDKIKLQVESFRTTLAQSQDVQNQTKQVTNQDAENQLTTGEQRAKKNAYFGFFYGLVINEWFNLGIFVLIVVNTILISVYRYDQSERTSQVLDLCNVVFSSIFLLEMVAKMIGLGFKSYFSDAYNVLDAIIVAVSIVDIALQYSSVREDDNVVISVLKAIRILRIFRLSRVWDSFREVMSQFKQSLIDVSNFTILLLLFIFVLALIGLEMFAYTVFLDADGNVYLTQEAIQEAYESGKPLYAPRENFNNIVFAMVTIFILCTGEDWASIATTYIRAARSQGTVSGFFAQIYFLSTMLIGFIVLLSLFTALLLQDFNRSNREKDNQIREENKKKFILEQQLSFLRTNTQSSQNGGANKRNCSCEPLKRLLKRLNFVFKRKFHGDQAALDRDLEVLKKKNPMSAASPTSGSSLPCQPIFFGPHAPNGNVQSMHSLAQLTNKMDSNRQAQRPVSLLHYDYDLLGEVQAYLLKQLTLRESPSLEGDSLFVFSPRNKFRKVIALITQHFLFEATIILMILISSVQLALENPLEDRTSLKLIVLQYIDKVTSVIFIVESVLKIIAMGFLFCGEKSYLRNGWNMMDFIIVLSSVFDFFSVADVSFLKVFRILRIMRPLRLVTRVKGIKLALVTLFKAFPSIFKLQVIVLFFLFTVGTFLTYLKSGSLSKCNLEHTKLSAQQQRDLVKNKWDCIGYGGEWVTSDLNLDNAFISTLNMFILQTREDHHIFLWAFVDSVGVDMEPQENHNLFLVILMIVLTIFFGLLFINMFVGIVIASFNREQDQIKMNHLLSEAQRKWVQLQNMTYSVKPVRYLRSSTNWIRNICIKIVLWPWFDTLILILIILNTVMMSIQWFNQLTWMHDFVEVTNLTFNFIFVLEAIIKLIALKEQYFKDFWNIYDFTIVILTNTFLLYKWLFATGIGQDVMILRSLRISRILRLVNKSQNLQNIFYTLVDSWSSLSSLGLLFLLFFFLFSVIAHQNFSYVKIGHPQGALNVQANFQTFSNSFLTLFRCATGEQWNQIMFDLARQRSITFDCTENETYETMMERGGEPNGCGNAPLAISFFVLFQVICMQIYLNLFIAIIIDAFLGYAETFSLPVSKYQIEAFSKVWSKFDPEGTGYIQLDQLDSFLHQLVQTKESKELVSQHSHFAANPELRAMFITKLEVPTYDQFRRVMFYDVLQLLCQQIHLDDMIHEKRNDQPQRALSMNTASTLHIFESVQDIKHTLKRGKSQSELRSLVENLVKNDVRIEYLRILKEGCNKVHMSHSRLVDTRSNIHLSHEERLELNEGELAEMSREGVLADGDIYVYTTLHVHSAKVILRFLRKCQLRSSQRGSHSADERTEAVPAAQAKPLRVSDSKPLGIQELNRIIQEEMVRDQDKVASSELSQMIEEEQMRLEGDRQSPQNQ